MGESGSGKSVTSLSIMGLHKAGAAKIIGRDLAGRRPSSSSADPETVRKLRGKTMAMIFQDPLSAMHPYYTVGAQIVEAYRLHHDVGKKAARKHAVEHARPGRDPAAATAGSTTTRTSSPAACGSGR